MTRRRTYAHLESLGRRPTDYDVATSRLSYHEERGFSVRTPVADWYAAHRFERTVHMDAWEAFDDTDAITYGTYVALRRDAEIFVDGALRGADGGEDLPLAPAWLEVLGPVLGTLRYPAHGFQMTSAYLGSMAPTGKIAALCLFQAADLLRVVHCLAYRTAQMERRRPGAFERGPAVWEEAPVFQPLRRLVERLLVVRDATEAFVALCLVGKPTFDALFLDSFARRARREGDTALAQVLGSLSENAQWHRRWSATLARRIARARPENRVALQAAIDRWWPLSSEVLASLGPVCEAPSDLREILGPHFGLAGVDAPSTREGAE